jgi:hypothetical protein
MFRKALAAPLVMLVFSNLAEGAELAPLQPKEITIGCVATPLPTTPSGPSVSFEANVGTPGAPRVIRGVLWRRPCAGAGDAQLIITFTPVSGAPLLCHTEAELIQGGVRTDNFFFDTNPNSSALETFCANLTQSTSVVIDEREAGFTFDDDLAFTFVYEVDSNVGPDVAVNVPAYDPAAYGAVGGNLLLSGKFSGSYFDPARAGEGMLLEIGRVGARRTVFLAWFTYVGGVQRWLVGNVDIAAGVNSVVIPISVTSGGQFGAAFNPAQVQSTPFGSVTLSFPGCTQMRFQWVENGGQSGVFNYQRLVDGLDGVVCP